MARINSLTNFLTDVADAIRNKTGKSDNIYCEDFDTEIASIQTGGNLQTKSVTITDNGSTTITPDSGYDGLSSVSVVTNVPSMIPIKISDEKNAIINFGNNFNDYGFGLVDTYTPLTTENVTLYTPNIDFKYYLIQKRASDKYRVVWCNSMRMLNGYNIFSFSVSWSQTQLQNNEGLSTVYIPIINHHTSSSVYYSTEQDTIEDCIQKMKSNQLTYTLTTNFLAYKADTPNIIPCANVPLYYCDYNDNTNDGFLVASNKISTNETFIQI